MHKAKDANLSPSISGFKSFLHYPVLLLVLAAIPVFGQGTIKTVAMVHYNQSPARTTTVARNNSATNLLSYQATAPRLPNRATELKLDHQHITAIPFDSQIEKKSSSSNQHDLLQLLHKRLYADGRSGKWMNVAAGYGQVCQFESGITKNTADLERPGCAYLKASFSF